MPRPQVWKIGDPKKLLLAVCLETLLDVTTVFSGANFLPTFPRWQIIIRGLRKGYENDGIGGLSQIRLGMSRSWRKITRKKKKKEKGVPDVPLEVLFRACYSVMPRLNCFPSFLYSLRVSSAPFISLGQQSPLGNFVFFFPPRNRIISFTRPATAFLRFRFFLLYFSRFQNRAHKPKGSFRSTLDACFVVFASYPGYIFVRVLARVCALVVSFSSSFVIAFLASFRRTTSTSCFPRNAFSSFPERICWR